MSVQWHANKDHEIKVGHDALVFLALLVQSVQSFMANCGTRYRRPVKLELRKLAGRVCGLRLLRAWVLRLALATALVLVLVLGWRWRQ